MNSADYDVTEADALVTEINSGETQSGTLGVGFSSVDGVTFVDIVDAG